MGVLPALRVSQAAPFSLTGIDVMGPWLCKRNSRADHKLWVTVFVCMNTRAVHTECITEMDAVAMINALVRFASRRPGVKSFYSDNGGNFTKAQKELRKEMELFAKDKREERKEAKRKKRAAEEDVEKELPERKAGVFGKDKAGQMEMDPETSVKRTEKKM